MEGIYFMVLWVGCALVHTLIELSVKKQLPGVQGRRAK